MDKKCKRATVGSSREIWCSNRETGRFHEKLGDSWENRESCQVCSSRKYVAFLYFALTFIPGNYMLGIHKCA